ncbi:MULTISPECIES: hypothetical protein [unclassified Streptomyces]|nr:hypothetical protein OG569_00255 [Streptomyces sp. NBC_00827]
MRRTRSTPCRAGWSVVVTGVATRVSDAVEIAQADIATGYRLTR